MSSPEQPQLSLSKEYSSREISTQVAAIFHLASCSVVANSVTLGRDLGAGNTNPGETFEFSEEILLNYPSSLAPKRLIWREVNP
jgi:hypothetical protein